MSLPSFQSPAHPSSHGHGHLFGHGKITKARSKTVVKPILKKLHSPHSEKNSLDLDRSWEEQTPAVTYSAIEYSGRDTDASGPVFSPSYAIGDTASSGGSARPPRSVRDVSFTLSSTELAGGGAGSGAARIKYSHARSTSGASHVSIATTNSGRNGSFIHPFQQTPQTSTPPLLSYTNSQVSLDNASVGPRDYSPAITEDDPDDDDDDELKGLEAVEQHAYHSTMAAATTAAARFYHTPAGPHPHPHADLRRPSLASSHRTSSQSDVTQAIAATTSRSSSGLALRTTYSSVNQSRADPMLGSASPITMTDSPLSTTAPIGSSPLMTASHSSCTTATSPMSPLRSSLDMGGFRLRSRSEVDTATRQEQVRQARRKFEEKERAKEEKYAREQVRKRERADTKEAQRFERAQTQPLRPSFGTGLSSARNSGSMEVRPRKSTTSGAERLDGAGEKVDFATRGYDSVPSGEAPEAKTDDVRFEPSRRRVTKRKTTGTWTAFVLWLRTRLLKLGRR